MKSLNDSNFEERFGETILQFISDVRNQMMTQYTKDITGSVINIMSEAKSTSV